jgi:hypothetical protein
LEFYLSLAALYTAQCLLKLDKHETLGWQWRFARVAHPGRARLIRGGGWRLAHPWPAAFVFSGRSGNLQSKVPVEIAVLREVLDVASRRTRALRWLSSLQIVWILVLSPTAAFVIGAEASILMMLGPALGLHVISIALLFRAERALRRDDPEGGDRLLIAALYPPSMWRAGAELVRAAGQEQQIAELASVVLSDREFELLIRTEIGRAKRQRATQTAADRDIAFLFEVASLREFDPDTLRAPRARTDPSAESYCEFCGGDYVAGYRYCQECQLTTTEYS